ncbi:MAG: hypothetical protein Q9221_004117 [Calogaya cf. arnoldii]
MYLHHAVLALHLLCLSFCPQPSFSLRFHGSCVNFAGKGDVTELLADAAENAIDVAKNAWDKLDSLDPRYMARPERDRINRILGSYAIGAGKRYYGRTIDGLIGRRELQYRDQDHFLMRPHRQFENHWQIYHE